MVTAPPSSAPASPRTVSDGLGGTIGVLLGLAVPASAFGNAALGAFFGLAALICAADLRAAPARRTLREVVTTKGGLAWAAVFVWWTFGTFVSSDPERSFEVMARMLLFAAGFLFLLQGLAARPAARQSAERVFAFGFAGVGVLAVVAFGVDNDLLHAFKPFSSDVIASQNMLKPFQSVVIVAAPVLIWIAARHGGWTAAASAIGCGTGAALILGLSGQHSRAALAGAAGALLAVGLVWALKRIGRKARIAAILALIAAGGIGAGAVLTALPAPPVTEADRQSGSLPVLDFHREAIWGFVYHKALEHPVLGYGINTIDRVPGAKDEVLDLNQEYVPAHPHNWMLEIFSETGAPGLLLVLAAIGICTAGLACRTFGPDAGTAWTAIAVMGAFWVSALANFSIWAAWWQVVFLTVMVLPLAALRANPRQD